MPERITERVTVRSTNLDEVTSRVVEIADDCADYSAPSFSDSRVSFEKNSFVLNYRDNLGRIHNSPLTPYSLGQLCGIVGVPVQYAEKCAATGQDWATELILSNLNEWISRNKRENSLIREYNDTVRGILTDKYTIFDAPDVMRGVTDGFGGREDEFSVEGYTVNPERLHIRIVKKTPVPGINEDLYAGLIINSSDVGRGAITIGYFLFKQVCTNGLIVRKAVGSSYRQVHLGSIAQIAAAVTNTVSGIRLYEEAIGEFIRKGRRINVAQALTEPESMAYETLFRRVKAMTGLPTKAVEQVFDTARVAYEPTIWGIVNGITDVAQSFSLDRRLALEEYAGRLLVAA